MININDIELRQQLTTAMLSKGTIDNEKAKIMNAWLHLFQEYNMTKEEILPALKKFAITKTYGLQFAEFYQLARPEADVKMQAEDEWQKLRNYNKTGKKEFSNKAYEVLKKITSLTELGYMNEYKRTQTKKEFMRLYEKENTANNKIENDNTKKIKEK
jgi:hypothetical protein